MALPSASLYFLVDEEEGGLFLRPQPNLLQWRTEEVDLYDCSHLQNAWSNCKIPPAVLKEPPAAKAHVTILVNDKVSNI